MIYAPTKHIHLLQSANKAIFKVNHHTSLFSKPIYKFRFKKRNMSTLTGLICEKLVHQPLRTIVQKALMLELCTNIYLLTLQDLDSACCFSDHHSKGLQLFAVHGLENNWSRNNSLGLGTWSRNNFRN